MKTTTILRQRLRAALTILGITGATTAVITVLAFGTGFQRQMVVNPGGDATTELATEWYSFDLMESLRYE